MRKINVSLCKESINLSNYFPSNILTNKPIKDIIMIGALVCGSDSDSSENPFMETTRCSMDKYALCDSFDALAAQGIPIDPNVSISVCNLEYGDDFIRDTLKADLQVLSYIWYSEDTKVAEDPMQNQSPLLTKTAWADALKRSEARYVVNFTDEETTIRNEHLEAHFKCISDDSYDDVGWGVKAFLFEPR